MFYEIQLSETFAGIMNRGLYFTRTVSIRFAEFAVGYVHINVDYKYNRFQPLPQLAIGS